MGEAKICDLLCFRQCRIPVYLDGSETSTIQLDSLEHLLIKWNAVEIIFRLIVTFSEAHLISCLARYANQGQARSVFTCSMSWIPDNLTAFYHPKTSLFSWALLFLLQLSSVRAASGPFLHSLAGFAMNLRVIPRVTAPVQEMFAQWSFVLVVKVKKRQVTPDCRHWWKDMSDVSANSFCLSEDRGA